MIDLDSLDESSKKVISIIVEYYNITLSKLEAGEKSLMPEPGCPFISLFNTEDCYISFYKEGDAIAIKIDIIEKKYSLLSDEGRRDLYFSIRKTKKNEFIQTAFLLKKLYDNGYIYFSKKSNEIIQINEYKHDESKNKTLIDVGIHTATEFYYAPELLDFIEKYQNDLIIPSFELISFRKNDYKTSEQKRYEKQVSISEQSLNLANESLNETKKSIIIANDSLSEARESNEIAKNANCTTLCIAIGTIVLSALISWYCASRVPTSIHESFTNQLNYNLERIISIDSVANYNLYNIQNRLDSIELKIKQPQLQPIQK